MEQYARYIVSTLKKPGESSKHSLKNMTLRLQNYYIPSIKLISYILNTV